MAKSKVARSKRPASLTRIEYSKQGGEMFARVRERSSGEFLAVAHGSPTYVRRVAQMFATVWSTEQAKAQLAQQRHSAQIDRIRRQATERATEAVLKMVGAS